MINIETLKTLCRNKETKIIEFKSSTALLRASFETVCAFLNGKGGTVLIGVRDDGRILGQHISDNTRKDIAKELKKLEPPAAIDVDYLDIGDGKFVIAINVKSGDHAPYSYDGRAFQRDESETNRMSQHRYEQLLVKRGQLNHSWEDFIVDDYNIPDLDQDEIYRTIIDGISEKRIPANIAKENIEKILRQLALITDNGQLKRAAIVLFAKEIKSPYSQCWIKLARFNGCDKGGDFIDNQQIHCNVFRTLEIADHFLRKHLPTASYFIQDQFRRIDKLALPILAIREALVNAICHRDYADRTGYISIAIFDDRIEIWSNGTLPKKLTLEDLKRKHDSVLRNELIAKIFYLRGYVESWGTGIKKMIDSCKAHEVPTPKFSERTSGIVVTFKFAKSIGTKKIDTTLALTNRQREILTLLENNSLNGAQLVEILSDRPSVRTAQKELVALEAAGLVTREGKARAIIWSIPKKQ